MAGRLAVLYMERSFALQTLERIRTLEVATHAGERVRVAGWLHSLRSMGGIHFLVIRDGWGLVQAVAESEAELAPLMSISAGLESVISRRLRFRVPPKWTLR